MIVHLIDALPYIMKIKKFNDNIDYFLYIKDSSEMDKILDYILRNNIWNYFKEINYSYKDIYKILNNSKGKEIGYLVLNDSNINQIDEIYSYMKENIEIRMDNNEAKDLKIDKFHSFLLCLYILKNFMIS